MTSHTQTSVAERDPHQLRHEFLWSVVEFTQDFEESTTVEVIPTTWITNFNNAITCKWPGRNSRKAIKKRTTPLSSWETWNIKNIFLQIDEYQTAVDFAKRKTNTDTDTSAPEIGRGKRKVKKKSYNDYTSDFSDHSQSHRITPPPMLSTVFDPTIERRRSNEVQQITKDLSAHIDNILPTVNNIIISDIDSNNNNDRENQIDQTDDIAVMDGNNNNNANMDLETCPTEGRNNIAGNVSPILINNFLARNVMFEDLSSDSQNIIKILENTIAIKKQLEQQNTFFQQLKERNDAPIIFAAAGPRYNDFSNIPTKPFKKHRKLLQYDTLLKNNEDGKKQLELFFYLLGGNSSQEQIKHSLEKMFSNKLAMKCSWKGQKGNFAINSLLIIDIIKNAARKHYPILTDKQFKDNVSAWLKYAKTRYDREQAKAQAQRNQDGLI